MNLEMLLATALYAASTSKVEASNAERNSTSEIFLEME
jgi:hypothetical protein